MNSAERDVIKQQYKDEQRALRELKQIYQSASRDLAGKIEELAIRYDETGLQSVIYQKQYQEAIKKQIDEGLKALLGNEYKTVNDFLKGSYENGFIGNVYMLHKQDIPLTLPIDQEKIVEALKIDSQLSRQYYAADPLKGKLGENYDKLKFRVRSSVSRGIAQGSSWQEVARNLAVGMNSPMKRAMNDSMRIARTEGHRINQQGFLDAGYKAKERGAQVVKQWDSTLDGRTRPEHRQADGQIREWDEDFDVGGEKLKAPGIGGSARNVINCRCCLLQRPVEAMDEAELETLKKRAEYFGLDKTKDFEEFKYKYLEASKMRLRNNLPSGFKDERIIGEVINKDDLARLIKDAESKHVKFGKDSDHGNFNLYHGEVGVLEKAVDRIDLNLQEAKKLGLLNKNEHIILMYDNVLGYDGDWSKIDIEAFASIKGRTITLNKYMYDDTDYLKRKYIGDVLDSFFAEGTSYLNIVDHEFGHRVDQQNPWLRNKVLNILQVESESANISLKEYIAQNVSEYASYVDINEEYYELVPELWGMKRGEKPEFALRILRKAGVEL